MLLRERPSSQHTRPIDSPGLQLIDLERYPLHCPNNKVLRGIIAAARADLQRVGCARIPHFVSEGMRNTLRAETESLAPHALHSSQEYTPYGTSPEQEFGSDHPRARAHRTTSGSVTRDLIPYDALVQQLYTNRHFKTFIAACLETNTLHEFADPMRGLIINTMETGNALGWHFDANEFTVSLMTRRAENGGTFEYCPDLRAPGVENYSAVRAILDGDRQPVSELDLQVGDLQLFKGRYALHRVTPIGRGCRHTVIFGYSRMPGYIAGADSTMRIYGRVTQAHIDADSRRHADGLTD